MPASIQPRKTYTLGVPESGVLSQVAGSSTVQIKKFEGCEYQKWTAEPGHPGLGFRNLKSQRLLGATTDGNPPYRVIAHETEIGKTEDFTPKLVKREGYCLSLCGVNYADDTWYTMFRPEQTEFLVMSNDKHTSYTPVVITECE